MPADEYPHGQPLIPMSEEDAARELAAFIGDRWSEELAERRGHPAQVPPAGTAEVEYRVVNVACQRAVDLARARGGELTESGEQVVRAAWFTLWVNAGAGASGDAGVPADR